MSARTHTLKHIYMCVCVCVCACVCVCSSSSSRRRLINPFFVNVIYDNIYPKKASIILINISVISPFYWDFRWLNLVNFITNTYLI